MSERVFFEHQDVKITNARFVNGTRTYAINNVTSIKTIEQRPKRFWAILSLVAGLAGAVNGSTVGILIAVTAAIVLFKQTTTYHVMLSAHGKETSAFRTYQKDYLQNIVVALNDAISNRS